MKTHFSFYACGGIGEIGLNCYILDFGDECYIVDCGLAICDNVFPAVMAALPDIESIKELKTRLKGIIITHGHDDHIGALPYFIDRLHAPIYASSFAMELLQLKVSEVTGKKLENITKIKGNNVALQIGSRIFKFFKTYHSIPESYGFYLEAEFGNIIFTSDFKHINTSLLPNKPLFLFVDATNAEVKDDVTEKDVYEAIKKILRETKGAFVATTFSTNLERINSIIKAVAREEKRLFVTGRSVITAIDIAKKLGIVKNINITPWEKINQTPREKVAIITTGTQGERFSSLNLLSHGKFKGFQLEKDDSVVISSRVIPGNERSIYGMINNFIKKGINVFYSNTSIIHSSGHGTEKELKKLILDIKPEYIIPIHGEFRHLKALKNLAMTLGYQDKSIIILDAETKLSYKDGKVLLMKHNPLKRLFLDSYDNSLLTEDLVKERRKLGEQGVCYVKIKKTPIISLNFETLGFRLNDNVKATIEDEIRKYVYSKGDENRFNLNEDMDSLKQIIKTCIKRYNKRKPFIFVTLEEGDVA